MFAVNYAGYLLFVAGACVLPGWWMKTACVLAAGALIGGLFEHTAHHVGPRVPLYHLPDAQDRLEAAYTADVPVERLTPGYVLGLMRTCRLYDYECRQWLDYDGTPTTPAQRPISTLRTSGVTGGAAGYSAIRCQSELLDGKFLDAVVVGVHDVQVAVAVEGEPVRRVELARLGPLPSEAAQVLALRRELLDAAADGTDPDPVVLIDADADRPLDHLAVL